MTSAVNCDNECELQNYVNHIGLERNLPLTVKAEVGPVERHLKQTILASNWSGLPTELKHIIMWRKRNQQGFPK